MQCVHEEVPLRPGPSPLLWYPQGMLEHRRGEAAHG